MVVLISAIICTMVIDKKYLLALFFDRIGTIVSVSAGLVFFAAWDIAGINLGIFFSGNSRYMSGLYLFQDFPVEEVLFLMFLCYFSLVVYRLGEKKL